MESHTTIGAGLLARSRHLPLRRVNAILFLIGLIALVALLGHVGLAPLEVGFRRLGWGFLLSCSAHLSALLLDAVTYQKCAGDRGSEVPYRVFARAGLAAHAINTATPTGTLGELSRYAMVRDHLSATEALSAVALLNLVMSVANFVFLAAALALAAVLLPLPYWLATALVIAAAVFFLLAVAVVALIRRGVGEWPFRVLRRCRVPEERVARIRGFWQEVEGTWRRAAGDRRRMTWVFATASLSRLATAAETVIILIYLDVDHLAGVALLATASSILVTWLTGVIPYQAGSAEGSSYLLFQAIGAAPAVGVMLELVRKARRIVFVALGIAVMGWQSFRDTLRRRE